MCDWWHHSWNILWGPSLAREKRGLLGNKSQPFSTIPPSGYWSFLQRIGRPMQSHFLLEMLHDPYRQRNLPKESCCVLVKVRRFESFAVSDLEPMLLGTESEVLHKIDDLAEQLRVFDTWEEKALTRKQIGELRSAGGDQSKRNFVDPDVRVVIATAFRSNEFSQRLCCHQNARRGRRSLHRTIFIDESRSDVTDSHRCTLPF